MQAEVLTGLPVTDLPSARTAMEALQAVGSRCIVLTLGDKGLLYSQLETNRWSQVEHMAAESVDVVDTTVRNAAVEGINSKSQVDRGEL